METFGYKPTQWLEGKEKAKKVIIEHFKKTNWTLTYSDLLEAIRGVIPFDSPDNQVFHWMLGQISEEEDDAERGLLTTLVVHKGGDGRPGKGWWKLAEQRGRDVANREECWVKEFKKLEKVYFGRSPSVKQP